MITQRVQILASILVLFAFCGTAAHAQQGVQIKTFEVGDTAPDIEFQPLHGKEKIKLSSLTEQGPVVLVVLRGFPGYQCPLCSRQLGDFASHAADFQRLGAKVVFIYPGPADELDQRANEFLQDTQLPEPFMVMIDPDYAFTNLYRLRWDEPRETAYPSTFVLDTDRKVKFRKISFSHGDRSNSKDVLENLELVSAAAHATGQEIPQQVSPAVPRR